MKFAVATMNFLSTTFLVVITPQVLGNILGEFLDNAQPLYAADCPASKSCHAVFQDEAMPNGVRWRDAQVTAAAAEQLWPPSPEECPSTKCKPHYTLKSYLVSVGSEDEQQCLEALINSDKLNVLEGTQNDPRPWIGGVQKIEKRNTEYEPAGGWKWDSGEPFYNGFCNLTSCPTVDLWLGDMVYHNFGEGEPNNGASNPLDEEHYLELNPFAADPLTWNDRGSPDVDPPLNNVYIVEYKCVPNPPVVNGDPHFSTWQGEKFDYHGECDLELMSDTTFNNGQGMAVHIRTTIVNDWSYVEAVAIKIGDDILEIQGSTSKAPYWINGEYQGQVESLGGFRLIQKTKGRRQRFFIILDDKSAFEVRSSSLGWLRIDISNPQAKHFGNVVGMHGDFYSGARLGRDGVTVFKDDNDFGQEWQVRGDAPMLFHNARAPQAPNEKCVLPSDRSPSTAQARLRRRQLMDLVSREAASKACRKVGIPECDFEDCVVDVMTVNDISIAGDYILDDDDEEEDMVLPGSVY